MVLERVGGRMDGGVDLQGWWFLPRPPLTDHPDHPEFRSPHPHLIRLRILAQCKAESKKLGPNYVREMEGVLLRYRLHPNEDNSVIVNNDDDAETGIPATIALLVSQSAFTKSTLLRALSSPVPFLLVHLPQSNVVNQNYVDVTNPSILPELVHPSTSPQSSSSSLSSGSAVWNPALSGSSGLLKDAFQLRWERDLSSPFTGTPALWMGRQRVPNCIPPSFPLPSLEQV